MKKRFGIGHGGLQRKTVLLVFAVLAVTAALFTAVSAYQNRMLVRIVGETRTEQQQAISQASQETMSRVLVEALVNTTSLQAKIADNDFSEIVSDAYTLRSIAQGLFENRENLAPLPVNPPDPALDGTVSAMVLCEDGVDYTRSEYLGIAAHMSSSMIAMNRHSDKIDGCYIGLADGTDLCVDDKAASKFDKDGNLIPFPVRERPWYKGAAETGGLYFTGVVRDAFSGKLLVTCSVPVEANGELVGVVGIDIVSESMTDFVGSSGEQSSAYVVNSSGQVILAPNKNAVFSALESDQAEDLRCSDNADLAQFVETALREPTELTLITIGDTSYYMAGAPMPTVGWAVISVVEKDLTEQNEKHLLARYDAINTAASAQFRDGSIQIRKTTILMIAVLVLLGLCAALAVSGRIVHPIEEMTRSIVNSSENGRLFEMQDCYRTHDEIEVLAEAFADLARNNQRYIEEITEITREKERVNTELKMANLIQNSMLPHSFPPFPERREFDLYASMDPAREVGGDFYDFFLIDEDHLCIVVADVSGKGVPAALFMMISKVILQSCAMLGKSAAEILTKTNEALCSSNQAEMFVTVWLGILEISTGRLTAANAGHEYPVLKKPSGSFEILKGRHGLVIGAMDGIRYREYTLPLEPGSKLFVYTDGVPEATNADNAMFGTDRMLSALNEDPDAAPEQLLRRVRRAVDDFVKDAEQFDDLTMLCLEFKGKEPENGGQDNDI